jgi:preprotein translocase subunit SecG
MIYFSYLLMTLLGFSGLFLIGLILLQRGRGGGLAGAFGGMGGQSWAGVRAGDVFTRITIGVAAAWILLCAGSVVALHNSTVQRATGFATEEELKVEKDKADEAAALREKAGAAGNDADLNLDFDTSKPLGDGEETKPEVKKLEETKAEETKAEETKAEGEKAAESNSSTPAVENKVEEPKIDDDKKPE